MAGDEQVRARVMPARQRRQALTLTADECWTLLGSVPVGRVVFSMNALPAIRPVNHILDLETIIIRSHLGAAITGHAGRDGAVVCYEADELDPIGHTGWSVIATGPARLIRNAATAARYERLFDPWADGQMGSVIAIRPQAITGIRLPGWFR